MFENNISSISRNFWNCNGTVPLYDGKSIEKKGLNLDGRYIVKMVDTYTLMFDLSDEEKCEKVTKDAEVCIDRVIEKVVNRVRG